MQIATDFLGSAYTWLH